MYLMCRAKSKAQYFAPDFKTCWYSGAVFIFEGHKKMDQIIDSYYKLHLYINILQNRCQLEFFTTEDSILKKFYIGELYNLNSVPF